MCCGPVFPRSTASNTALEAADFFFQLEFTEPERLPQFTENADYADALCVNASGEFMTLKTRKMLVLGVLGTVLLLSNAMLIAKWLDVTGAIGWASHIRSEYLTGTPSP